VIEAGGIRAINRSRVPERPEWWQARTPARGPAASLGPAPVAPPGRNARRASIGEAQLPDDLGDRPLAMFAEQGVEFAIDSSEGARPFLD
jgi:hypothetical protein